MQLDVGNEPCLVKVMRSKEFNCRSPLGFRFLNFHQNVAHGFLMGFTIMLKLKIKPVPFLRGLCGNVEGADLKPDNQSTTHIDP